MDVARPNGLSIFNDNDKNIILSVSSLHVLALLVSQIALHFIIARACGLGNYEMSGDLTDKSGQ